VVGVMSPYITWICSDRVSGFPIEAVNQGDAEASETYLTKLERGSWIHRWSLSVGVVALLIDYS